MTLQAKRVVTGFALMLLLVASVFFASSCAGSQQASSQNGQASSQSQNDTGTELVKQLRIGSMKGPTSIGLADMMKNEMGNFTVVAAADELTPLLLQDQLDIALVPANVAALLYQKTSGAICVLDVNTLGVLYGVSQSESVASLQDFAGRTIYMTGKNSVPEYTLRALLASANISFDDVNVEFRSEPAEVAALIQQNPETIGILPQPYVTSVTLKNSDVHIILDLTKAWAEYTGGQQGDLITGVTIAKQSFVEENPDALNEFLKLHKDSVEIAQNDPAAIAPTVVEMGIIDSEKIAEQAIPKCNVVCLTGIDMQQALQGYLEMLYQQNPQSIGGSLPSEAFYYVSE